MGGGGDLNLQCAEFDYMFHAMIAPLNVLKLCLELVLKMVAYYIYKPMPKEASISQTSNSLLV